MDTTWTPNELALRVMMFQRLAVEAGSTDTVQLQQAERLLDDATNDYCRLAGGEVT